MDWRKAARILDLVVAIATTISNLLRSRKDESDRSHSNKT